MTNNRQMRKMNAQKTFMNNVDIDLYNKNDKKKFDCTIQYIIITKTIETICYSYTIFSTSL